MRIFFSKFVPPKTCRSKLVAVGRFFRAALRIAQQRKEKTTFWGIQNTKKYSRVADADF
jgi:hypothetical protein